MALVLAAAIGGGTASLVGSCGEKHGSLKIEGDTGTTGTGTAGTEATDTESR